MDQTFTCFLLLLSSSATFGKYVYVERETTWHRAQDHCRSNHTDLAPVSNMHDMWRLWSLVPDFRKLFWIGLVRNFTDREKWTWSGGGGVSTYFWAQGQPENREDEDYGVIQDFGWRDGTPDHEFPFFCYNAIVVRERKTWEDALDYCREHHHDLASVASETEMMLIEKELHKNNITDQAWVGLHYFPGHWLWVDKQPLSYEAWGPGGKPACPEVRQACAALQMKARMQRNNGTDVTNENVLDLSIVFPGSDASAGGEETEGRKERVWEARDCEERHYFVCQ